MSCRLWFDYGLTIQLHSMTCCLLSVCVLNRLPASVAAASSRRVADDDWSNIHTLRVHYIIPLSLSLYVCLSISFHSFRSINYLVKPSEKENDQEHRHPSPAKIPSYLNALKLTLGDAAVVFFLHSQAKVIQAQYIQTLYKWKTESKIKHQ